MRSLGWVLPLVMAGCDGTDTGGGEMCEAGTLDCACLPALPTGCEDGLTCSSDSVCIDGDADTSGDTDPGGDTQEYGPLSTTMLGWTVGQDTAALCRNSGQFTSYAFAFGPTCNSGEVQRWSWFNDPSNLVFVARTSDGIATASHGTIVPGDESTADQVDGLPVDTDVTITTSAGVTYTFQLAWNEGESTYDVSVSSLTEPL